jgi:23S rRNA (uracil1939-C5)-methyltransferase
VGRAAGRAAPPAAGGGREATLLVTKLVAGGEGLGFIDGKAVFVPGVLPGELVRVRLVQRRRDFERAALLEVLTPSAHRAASPCRLAGVCGGCDWLHIGYAEQLAQKVALVRETLRRTGRIECPEIGIEPSPPLGSRNRVQVHRDEQGRLGFMGAGSTRVVPVETCPIVVPPINGLFDGTLRGPRDMSRFTAFSDGTLSAVEGIDDARDLAAQVCGRRISLSVGCFFQSNLAVLQKLVPWTVEGLAGAAAADLYCGVGLFGAFLLERFPRLHLVESSTVSISHARRNAAGPGSEFFPMDVEQWISSGAARGPLDAVIVDPPRVGLSAEVRQWLCDSPPARLVYVSCNPVTLARDLGQLCGQGFRLESLRLFDFYPQTSHVEAVARLARGGPA